MTTSIGNRRLRTGLACVILAAAGGVATSLAAEAEIGTVTVRADRPTEKVVGRSASGLPVVQYELSYRVAYTDLDLATANGVTALKDRVKEAAKSVCAELDEFYPLTAPDRQCAAKAADDAMAQVDAAVAAARQP